MPAILTAYNRVLQRYDSVRYPIVPLDESSDSVSVVHVEVHDRHPATPQGFHGVKGRCRREAHQAKTLQSPSRRDIKKKKKKRTQEVRNKIVAIVARGTTSTN